MTSATARLVSVGNVLVDVVVRGHLPERGGDSVVTSDGMTAGGAFNALLAARRQGMSAAYAGGHGTGPFGDLARTALEHAGIGILLAPSPELDTGYDIAVIEPDGERSFLTLWGAEAHLTPEQLGSVRLGAADYLLVSGYGLLPTSNAAVLPNWVEGVPRETVVVVDPGPLVADIPGEAWRVVAERADWVSCNEREALLLAGEMDAARAAAALATPTRGAVVRLGAEGCLLATAGTVERVQGFAVTPLDTNGAGDAHTGAFIAALAEGLPPREAAVRANACAALAVTRPGPATAPTRAETLALLRNPAR